MKIYPSTTVVIQGGGTAVINWGPNFGTPGGDSLPQVQAITMPALGLSYGLDQTQALRNPNLALSTALSQVQSIRNPNLELTTALTQIQSISIPNLGLSTDISQTQAIRNPNLGLSMAVSQTQTLGGKILGAPFWQSVGTKANNAAGSTSIIIPKPSGLVVGDLMLAFIGTSKAATDATVNTPTGWALVRATGLGGVTQVLVRSFWKIADSADVAASDFTFTFTASADNSTGEIHRINAAHATTPIDASNGATLAASAADPDPSAPAVTTVAANCLVFAFLFHSHAALTQSHTPPASHVERTDFQNSNTIIFGSTSATRTFASPGLQAAVEFNCTETVATDAVMQRVSIAPGEQIIA